MVVQKGSILVSTPMLHETIFEQSIILITEINAQGAIGVVLNKIFPKNFNELVTYSNSKPFTLYNGGPVATESLFFIHNCPHLIKGSTAINDILFIGGNFEQAVKQINQNNIANINIQLFIGYCGWDAGELEAEIEEGSWLVSNNSAHLILSSTKLEWLSLYKEIC